MLFVRPAAVADLKAVAMLTDIAFRQTRDTAVRQTEEAKLVERLRRDGDAVFSLLAENHDDIVGHLMLSRMTAPFRALGLAPLSVHPAFQNQGIGSTLVHDAIRRARADGWSAIFVLGDVEYYSRFGFSARLAAGFECTYAGPSFMVLPLDGSLPVASGRVDYARAFGRLVSH